MHTLPRIVPLLLAGVFFTTLGSGCKAAPPVAAVARPVPATLAGVHYDPAAPLEAKVVGRGGTEVRSFAVRYRGANGEPVPGLLTLPAGRGRVPCVLLLHGLGGSKGDMFLPGQLLAARGYASLAIDIAEHGERPRPSPASPPSRRPLADLRRAAAQTVVDLRRGVDFLQTRPEIDAGRIGFLGISLGGILGGVFAAEEPRIRATVLWSAGGDWGRLITQSRHRFAQRLRGQGANGAAAIGAELADVDPARLAGRIAPRPLLMIHGTKDTVVPPACAEALYGAAGQPKRLILLPGGHIPDFEGMLGRTVRWLDANLKKG